MYIKIKAMCACDIWSYAVLKPRCKSRGFRSERIFLTHYKFDLFCIIFYRFPGWLGYIKKK